MASAALPVYSASQAIAVYLKGINFHRMRKNADAGADAGAALQKAQTPGQRPPQPAAELTLQNGRAANAAGYAGQVRPGGSTGGPAGAGERRGQSVRIAPRMVREPGYRKGMYVDIAI